MRRPSVPRSALAALALGACIRPPVVPVTTTGVSYPVQSASLGAGAIGVFETSPDVGLAGAVLVVEAGSADEAPEKAGLAHLVEHLVMEDPRNGPSIEERLEELGAGSYNAATGWDETPAPSFATTIALRSRSSPRAARGPSKTSGRAPRRSRRGGARPRARRPARAARTSSAAEW